MSALEEQIERIAERVVERKLAQLRPAPTSGEDDRGVTADEASDLLGVSKWRVYEMVKRGVLRTYRPSPRTLRIPLGSILAFRRGAPDGPGCQHGSPP